MGTQIHDAIGDGGGGKCLFAEFRSGQHFKLSAGSQDHDLTSLADAIQASLDPDLRTVEIASDTLPPMQFPGRCVEAGDDSTVGPQIDKLVFDHKTGNKRHIFRYIIDELALRTAGFEVFLIRQITPPATD